MRPTPEQLALISRLRDGVDVIRGAAGSGKTTTALLRLRSSIASAMNRKRRQNRTDPVRILLLTYNKTLRGYVSNLAQQQFAQTEEIELEVSTFSKWAWTALDKPRMLERADGEEWISGFAKNVDLPDEFVIEEVNYLLGKFLPENLTDYMNVRRDGRGGSPKMEKPTREALLNEVVFPYLAAKAANGLSDWNDVAVGMARAKYFSYDIVIADETQDFSANQIRGIMNQLMNPSSTTFILDTAQRIYASGFIWQEVGIVVRPENSFRLSSNYRNTKEIALFAASFLKGLSNDDDGTSPNFDGTMRTGSKPRVVVGLYRNQLADAIKFIKDNVDLENESVAILQPRNSFSFARTRLVEAGLPYVAISRESEWPTGPENIALSTLHSAKGLEFDHVFILGLNAEMMPHGPGEDDDRLVTLRRLVAMGIGRAKISVTLGYKGSDVSEVMKFADKKTFDEVAV